MEVPMERVKELLIEARAECAIQIQDGRERAIVVRYIEDALCRLIAAPQIPPMPLPPGVGSGRYA